MANIAITTSSFGKYDESPLKLLKDKGIEILFNPYGRKLARGEIIGLCKDVTGIIAGTELLDRDILERLKNLRVISRCGSGLDNVDLEYARRVGIKVFNTPEAPTNAVAELSVALMLNLLRKVHTMDFNLRKEGRWEKMMGNLIHGKKIGIVGFGRVGKRVAVLLGSFGCIVKYSDPYIREDVMNLERLSLEELLAWSDIVSIHASSDRVIIGHNEIQLMKKGAWLVNVARGSVINEEALYKALNSNYLSGAALDVFSEEPYNGLLKECSNVILTPHIGSYAVESRVEMEMQAVKNLLNGLESKEEDIR